MPPRSEPLLWIQLLSAGLLPLEVLLLLLVLAGSDPGPVPALERLLCWGLGALAPALLLWNRPADVWSLLLVQTPLRARRPLQRQLSRLQQDLVPRLMLVFAGVAALPLLWWLDDHAAIAGPYAPLTQSPRLVVLLIASLVLAMMTWQWQQLVQSLWLLCRSAASLETISPMEPSELEEQRLCLGVPLLMLQPLIFDTPTAPSSPRSSTPVPASVPAHRQQPDQEGEEAADNVLQDGASAAADAVAIEPEQAAEQEQGGDLDQQIL